MLNAAYWDIYWSRPYFRYEKHQEWFWGEVKALLKGKILDVGCGSASMWRGTDYDVTGFDYSPQGIEEAKKNYPKGRFFVSDLKDFVPERVYDTVVCVGVAHYYLPDLSALRDALRASTRDRLVVTLNSPVDINIFKDWGKLLYAKFEDRKGWVLCFSVILD